MRAADHDRLRAAWRRVAAEGTDPDRLREAVVGHRLVTTPDDVAVPQAWARLGVAATVPGGQGWDDRLAALGDTAPSWLAWRGGALTAGPNVAIVGARRSTGYGREVAAWLAEDLVRAGVAVVSGGAMGIDAAAHEAALATEGRTVVVLGCGHDVAYPSAHAQPGGLFDRVVAAGGTVVSTELPHARPERRRVRARNRIVAALADAVVVVEGAARSGTLVTAGFAGDLGVQVLAVPGDVRAPLSAAPHLLLHEGAAPCRSAADVLDVIGHVLHHEAGRARPPEGAAAGLASGVVALPAAAAALLADAWPRSVPLDVLAGGAGVAAPTLLAALTRARIAGEVTLEGAQVRLRRRPSPS